MKRSIFVLALLVSFFLTFQKQIIYEWRNRKINILFPHQQCHHLVTSTIEEDHNIMYIYISISFFHCIFLWYNIESLTILMKCFKRCQSNHHIKTFIDPTYNHMWVILYTHTFFSRLWENETQYRKHVWKLWAPNCCRVFTFGIKSSHLWGLLVLCFIFSH